MEKSTVEEIRARFDADVERFSRLDTGQSSTVDSPLAMSLVTRAAALCTPHATHAVDIGCGAGNYSLKLLEQLPGLAFTLIDLSQPMLDRALERLREAGATDLRPLQGDIRELSLGENYCDIVVASAVLHHLRTDAEWEAVFSKVFRALRPGGSFWVFDLVWSDRAALRKLFDDEYAAYLTELGGADYQRHVFDYIAKEDTPRSLEYQLDLLKRVGFGHVEVLHKKVCFAAFGAIKS